MIMTVFLSKASSGGVSTEKPVPSKSKSITRTHRLLIGGVLLVIVITLLSVIIITGWIYHKNIGKQWYT